MTTRSKNKSLTPTSKPNNQTTKRVENSWILLMKESLFENDNFKIITLPHPGHGNPTKYCLDNVHCKIYEVVTFREPYRSWFMGETVKSDGSIMITTPVNALFLVLPRLRDQCNVRAIPLEDLLSVKGFENLLDFVPNLDSIGDLKGPPEMKAYKYNEEKTLAWLETRVRKLAQVLRQKDVHVTSGAVSATYVASSINSNTVDEEVFLKYAHGVISEYLQEDLAELLEKKFEFQHNLIETIGKKRKPEAMEVEQTDKKLKCDLVENGILSTIHSLNVTTTNELIKQKPLTAKEKARQKAASGTKTISSFFFKK